MWTSIIFQAPLTVSEWVFEVQTITAPAFVGPPNKRTPMHHTKRQAAVQTVEFYPTLAPTPTWPAIVYEGPDGVRSTASPTEPVPTPPPAITPGAAAPPSGAWPLLAIRAALDPFLGETPLVGVCSFIDFDCQDNLPSFGLGFTNIGEDPDYEENFDELAVVCPPQSTMEPTIMPSPRATAFPQDNKVKCHGKGQAADNLQLRNAVSRFCLNLAWVGRMIAGGRNLGGGGGSGPLKRDVGEPPVEPGKAFVWGQSLKLSVFDPHVEIGIQVNAGCEWEYNFAQCERYLRVAVNSCDCQGENGKHGGTVQNNCLLWWLDPNTFAK